MKVCLIGCGAHARDCYLPSLRRLAAEGRIEPGACCDLSDARADAMRRDGGFERCYTDFGKMLANERPEALFVVTPYSATADVVESACRESDCAIMLEKPPGSTVREAMRIRHALDDGRRLHAVAFNRHFMPSFNALKERLDGERLQYIDYQMLRVNRSEPFFFVTAIHGIDAVRHIVDSPYVSCSFSYQDLPDLGENCRNMFIDAEFASGARGRLAFLVQSGLVAERINATCRDRSFTLTTPIWHGTDTPGALNVYEGGKMVQAVEFPTEDMFVSNGFYAEMSAFVRSVELNRPQEHVSMDAAMQSVEIAECLRYRRKHFEALT